jgi:Adenylate kinase and related kinases
MVLERLFQPDVREGFILDGYPRTVPQAQSLERALAEKGQSISAVQNFKISDAVAVKRLMARLVCPNCKRSYNTEFKPPRVAGICDVCGHELVNRADDDEETIMRRLEVYKRETKPLVLYFWERGLLRDIDAEAPERSSPTGRSRRSPTCWTPTSDAVIVYKSPDEIDKMRRAGRIVAGTIDRVLAAVHPNVTTAELDDVAETYIREQGATRRSRATAPDPAGYRSRRRSAPRSTRRSCTGSPRTSARSPRATC